VRIHPAEPTDADAIWTMLEPVVREGEVFALPRDMSRADGLAYWMGADRETFVFKDEHGAILGSYYVRPNQQGGGAHVANCGYLTDPHRRGEGVARAMCQHSLDHARARGYRAMQFNFVISTNERAVRLWESFGFETLARLPGAFGHPKRGFVDALVMFRAL